MDYDKIAHGYDRRYELHDYPGIRATLLGAIEQVSHPVVLEVGCGTGHWLAALVAAGCAVAGIDPSAEMLRLAARKVKGDLRQGSAEALPWDEAAFDLVYYVNALHHVTAPEGALSEAYRVLRPGGRFLAVGLDPHEDGDRWFVWEFFPETVVRDRARFASRARRTQWLEAAGFRDVTIRVAEHLQFSRSLEEALRTGILTPSSTSQLAALPPAEYAAGMDRIRQAAQQDKAFRLETDLRLYATEARRSA